ncbi:unnamed protein product, partial [marine sediment metagenome]
HGRFRDVRRRAYRDEVMKYLLDTHVLLWSISKSKELSGKARGIIEDSSNEVFVSSVSLWEISLKYSLGKLVLGSIGPEDIPSYCNRLGYQIMPIGPIEASTYHNLKKFEDHKDPFDRMLIHQCIQMKMILVSRDTRMGLYKKQGLKCIWR